MPSVYSTKYPCAQKGSSSTFCTSPLDRQSTDRHQEPCYLHKAHPNTFTLQRVPHALRQTFAPNRSVVFHDDPNSLRTKACASQGHSPSISIPGPSLGHCWVGSDDAFRCVDDVRPVWTESYPVDKFVGVVDRFYSRIIDCGFY